MIVGSDHKHDTSGIVFVVMLSQRHLAVNFYNNHHKNVDFRLPY